jgi:hypothetical protein
MWVSGFGYNGAMADPPKDDATKAKLDALIGGLELATGEILFRDKTLLSLVTKMRQDLFALRAVLGVERPH